MAGKGYYTLEGRDLVWASGTGDMPPPGFTDVHDVIAAAVDDDTIVSVEWVKDLLAQMLDMNQVKWATCPNCGKIAQVKKPDFNSIGKLFETLVRLKERPKEAPKADEEDARIEEAVARVLDKQLEGLVARLNEANGSLIA